MNAYDHHKLTLEHVREYDSEENEQNIHFRGY